MSIREREGLITRIRQIRRVAGAADERPQPAPAATAGGGLQALEARVEQLEALVQGLQDSVHRESTRHSNRIADLEARTQPAALGRSLSEDRRARGL